METITETAIRMVTTDAVAIADVDVANKKGQEVTLLPNLNLFSYIELKF